MADIGRYGGQALFFAIIAVFIGYFSTQPSLDYFAADSAQIKLSFVHGASRVVECRRLTSEEIAKLKPSERRPNTCARERIPIRVQLLLGEAVIYDEVLAPTGLSRDGPARVYRKFQVPAGRREITARLRDTARKEGFDYERRIVVDLAPLQNLAIDFQSDQGTFVIR